MDNNILSFSICIPVYNGSKLLKGALESIFRQRFTDYEIIIGDDNPPELKDEIEETRRVVKSFGSDKIRYHKNQKNLGYARNLQSIVSRAKNDVIFLMAQDDILSLDSLQSTHDAFFLDPEVGAVTRPYFWFDEDINRPVRAVEPWDARQDSVLSLFDGKQQFMKIFESLGQLSGLAYRNDLIEIPFHDEVFPAHIYPFAGILRKHKCVFLKDYTVAVGIRESQTRSVSSIYDLSPTESWLKMYRTVFEGDEYCQLLEWSIEHICTNYLGLVQLKNYARTGVLQREIAILIKNRWTNLFSPKFWFFALGTSLIPRAVLIPLVDIYKSRLNSRKYSFVSFRY